MVQSRCNELWSAMLALKILSRWSENLKSTVLFSMTKWVWISSLRKVIHPNTFCTLLCDLWKKYQKKFAVVKKWKYYSVQHQNFSSNKLKVVSTTFLLVCVLCLKDSTCETRKIVFLFHLESSFCSSDNQILTFQILKCHDVIKYPSMKHERHFIE